MSGSPAGRRYVDVWDLRRRFNDDRVWERVESGELAVFDESRRPGGSQSGQPPGTVSVFQRVYTNRLDLVAMVHYFERPDGTRTRPDPKYLVVDDEIWKPLRGGSAD